MVYSEKTFVFNINLEPVTIKPE